MAGSITTTGLDELYSKLGELSEAAPAIAAVSLYEGAKVAADAYNRAIASIPVEQFQYAAGGRMRDPSPEEVGALMGAAGIAKFNKNGTEVDTLVGVSGYGVVNGKQKPLPMIARAINSGTSFMRKHPFARQVKSAAKGPARAAIVKEAERRLKQITNK